ncbi:DUF721 domain-containing protein [Pseudomonas sp. UL073]|uniref:DUF721 domain-containing protein n=1 Tax=Zestomonas insulae TaxID=2809017 RepID=A0ABS2II57_9GAMM|nr:DciA family protein [Pseudomonas insulae]MBM7061625.1 DUF721 domain-containing protein [Pseudomonas insulae]
MTFRPLPARSPAALLREAKPLQGLLNQAERLDHLQRLVDSQLQPAAREHCKVASWRDGGLLLIITDGHWATRLRYQQRRLLRQLQTFREFAELNRILFKVQPPQGPSARQGRTVSLSDTAADSIRESAEHISDPRLRAALERLASHRKPSDS